MSHTRQRWAAVHAYLVAGNVSSQNLGKDVVLVVRCVSHDVQKYVLVCVLQLYSVCGALSVAQAVCFCGVLV